MFVHVVQEPRGAGLTGLGVVPRPFQELLDLRIGARVHRRLRIDEALAQRQVAGDLVELRGDKARSVATDGHRLAFCADWNETASAQAEVRAAQRDRIRNQIALDVWKAYQSLTTATQSLKTTADLVASAEQSERVALGRYKAGVGTVLDLLSAQSALASARLQRIQAQLDWNVYRATLAQTMGALDYTLLQPAAEGRP